jgi:hypothetical protein
MQKIHFKVIMCYLMLKTGARCFYWSCCRQLSKERKKSESQQGAISPDLWEEKKVFFNFSGLTHKTRDPAPWSGQPPGRV